MQWDHPSKWLPSSPCQLPAWFTWRLFHLAPPPSAGCSPPSCLLTASSSSVARLPAPLSNSSSLTFSTLLSCSILLQSPYFIFIITFYIFLFLATSLFIPSLPFFLVSLHRTPSCTLSCVSCFRPPSEAGGTSRGVASREPRRSSAAVGS